MTTVRSSQAIGWTFLKCHVEFLIANFPELKGEFGEEGGIHQDNCNVMVRQTDRQMVGQVDVSTIDYEGDMDDIEEADEPMTVNATETENKDESIVKTDRDTSHKTTN